MKDYLKIAGNIHLSYYVEAADILNIQYEIIIPALMAQFHYQDKHWFIINTVTPLNNTPSCTVARRKNLTNIVLAKSGIPVPKQAKILNEQDALNFFYEYKNIVIKPLQGFGGHGVAILPRTEEEIIQAYKLAAEKSYSKEACKVLAEEFVEGENYRILVLDDQILGVAHRVPAHIIGDGVNNIKTLIDNTNAERAKRLLYGIPVDSEVDKKLKTLDMSLESIPAKDAYVPLRFNANLSTGGTTEECAANLHPYYKEIAIKAVKAVGLKFAGVDLITTDITQPVKCAINEVNYNPGLRPHYKPDKGEVVKVAVPVMKYIIEH